MQSAHYEVDLINFDNNNDVDDEKKIFRLYANCRENERASERTFMIRIIRAQHAFIVLMQMCSVR